MSELPTSRTAFRLQPGGTFGFNDAGEAVGVTWPDPEPETFEETLRFHGIAAADAHFAANVFDHFLTRKAEVRAAQLMRTILARMMTTKTAKTPEFIAFVAIFSPDRSLSEIASGAGISKQTLHFHVQKLRPILTPLPLVSGDAPDETTTQKI